MHFGRILKTGLLLAAVLLIAGCAGLYDYDYDYGYGPAYPYPDNDYYYGSYGTPFTFGFVAPYSDFDYDRFHRGDWDRDRWSGEEHEWRERHFR